MQHVVHAFAGLAAGVGIADVALDEAEAAPLFGRHQLLHHVEVVLVSGEEIVEAHDALAVGEQGLQQVGADEPGHAGDEPRVGFRFKPLEEFGILGHGLLRRKGSGLGSVKPEV